MRTATSFRATRRAGSPSSRPPTCASISRPASRPFSPRSIRSTRSSSCADARRAARPSDRASSPRRSCRCRAPCSAAAASIRRVPTRRAPRIVPARRPPEFRPRTRWRPCEPPRHAVVDAIKTLIIVTRDGPEQATLKLIADETERLGILTHHARRVGHRHRRSRRRRHRHPRAHAAHRPARRGDGEEDRRRRHSDGLDARGVRALLQRREHAAVPRPPAVSVRHVVERRPRARSTRGCCSRPASRMPTAPTRAGHRAIRCEHELRPLQPRVLARGSDPDHDAKRRDRRRPRRRLGNARGRQARRHRDPGFATRSPTSTRCSTSTSSSRAARSSSAATRAATRSRRGWCRTGRTRPWLPRC